MDRVAAEQPSWGVVYFSYDTFAAFRTDVARAVRWDNFIHHYLSDCDWCGEPALAPSWAWHAYPFRTVASHAAGNSAGLVPGTHDVEA